MVMKYSGTQARVIEADKRLVHGHLSAATSNCSVRALKYKAEILFYALLTLTNDTHSKNDATTRTTAIFRLTKYDYETSSE